VEDFVIVDLEDWLIVEPVRLAISLIAHRPPAVEPRLGAFCSFSAQRHCRQF
jgi:hypothetical protein